MNIVERYHALRSDATNAKQEYQTESQETRRLFAQKRDLAGRVGYLEEHGSGENDYQELQEKRKELEHLTFICREQQQRSDELQRVSEAASKAFAEFDRQIHGFKQRIEQLQADRSVAAFRLAEYQTELRRAEQNVESAANRIKNIDTEIETLQSDYEALQTAGLIFDPVPVPVY